MKLLADLWLQDLSDLAFQPCGGITHRALGPGGGGGGGVQHCVLWGIEMGAIRMFQADPRS